MVATMEATAADTRARWIDSLRCYAMTAVVAQHCGLLPFGWTGVWLFFVISGYVVTLSVIRRPRPASASAGLMAFFRRRALRIVPVYYAYVLVGVAVLLAGGAGANAVAVGSLLAFVNNLAMILGRGEIAGWPVGHLWTISVEMQFYLLYGLALFFAPRRVVVGLLVGAVALSPVLRFLAAAALAREGWTGEPAAYAIYAGSFLHSDAFAWGALLALAGAAGTLKRVARPLALAGFLVLGLYAATFVAINRVLLGEEGIGMLRNVVSGVVWGEHREVVLYSALNVASAGLVALAASGDRLVRPLLAHPLTQWIGEISYGAYVYHSLAITLALRLLFPSLNAASEPLTAAAKLVLFATAYAATIAAAALSYRCFESRFLRASARGPGPAIRLRSAPSPHPRRPDPVAAALVEAALTSRREPR